MEKITNEMCVVFYKDHCKSKIVLSSVLSAFVLIALGLSAKSILVVVAAALLLGTLNIIIWLIIKNRINHIHTEDFYLEEDVVADFKKRFRLERNGADHRYIYTFQKYGKYEISLSIYPTFEIPLHREKNISALAVEKAATQSCSKGDGFYLLICKIGGKKKIIQAFYKRRFAVRKEDFDCIDGRYFCKKIG